MCQQVEPFARIPAASWTRRLALISVVCTGFGLGTMCRSKHRVAFSSVHEGSHPDTVQSVASLPRACLFVTLFIMWYARG